MVLIRNYKKTEVGVIPQDWVVKSAGKIGTVVRGGSPRPAGDPRYFNGSYIPWLTVAALTNIPVAQLVVTETATCLTEEGSLHSRILNADTLIIANSGATLGVAKILGFKCCANDGIAALLDLSKDVHARYLAHYINTKTSYLREVVATGNGQPNLNTSLIGDLKIPFPPTKTEQEAIANALSDVDNLVASLEHLLDKKRHIKQGTMEDLLTGKRRLSGFGEPWAMKFLKDIFNFSGGFTASRDQLTTDGCCYLHYGDIHSAKRTFIDVQSEFNDIPKLTIPLKKVPSTAFLEDGDVVFVDASEDDDGTSKHLVVINPGNIPFISGLHTIVAKSKTDEVDHRYRRYCFQTTLVKAQFRFFAVGTKVSGISKTNIKKITIPLPPVDEQIAIAAILSDIDAEIATLETKLTKARQIKQGMMQELLTGRIRLI